MAPSLSVPPGKPGGDQQGPPTQDPQRLGLSVPSALGLRSGAGTGDGDGAEGRNWASHFRSEPHLMPQRRAVVV